jgi:hypothetical protein
VDDGDAQARHLARVHGFADHGVDQFQRLRAAVQQP